MLSNLTSPGEDEYRFTDIEQATCTMDPRFERELRSRWEILFGCKDFDPITKLLALLNSFTDFAIFLRQDMDETALAKSGVDCKIPEIVLARRLALQAPSRFSDQWIAGRVCLLLLNELHRLRRSEDPGDQAQLQSALSDPLFSQAIYLGSMIHVRGSWEASYFRKKYSDYGGKFQGGFGLTTPCFAITLLKLLPEDELQDWILEELPENWADTDNWISQLNVDLNEVIPDPKPKLRVLFDQQRLMTLEKSRVRTACAIIEHSSFLLDHVRKFEEEDGDNYRMFMFTILLTDFLKKLPDDVSGYKAFGLSCQEYFKRAHENDVYQYFGRRCPLTECVMLAAGVLELKKRGTQEGREVAKQIEQTIPDFFEAFTTNSVDFSKVQRWFKGYDFDTWLLSNLEES